MVYKNFKTIADVTLKGKTVLLRVDINSNIVNKKPIVSGRLLEHSKTISLLKKKGARVIVLAHQSRPGEKDFTSLKNHAVLMNNYTKITFVNEVVGKKVEKSIETLNNGEAILLENIRREKDEFKVAKGKNNQLVTFFKKMNIDYYINDEFSVCHRNEASISLFPLHFKSVIGPVLLKELKNIDRVKGNISKSVFVLGGSKVEDIALLIKKNTIIPTGKLAILVLKAFGYDVGKAEDKDLQKEYAFLSMIKKKKALFVQPEDLAYDVKGKRMDVSKDNFPKHHLALDIGKESVAKYIKVIQKSKYVFWKGTAGDISKKRFSYGTRALLKAIEKSNAYCVAAGGDSETAIRKYKINKNKFGYVSLSGGALVHYISGRKLPGLIALEKSGKKRW